MRLNPKQTGQEKHSTKAQVLSEIGKAMFPDGKPLDHAYMLLIQCALDTKNHSILRLPASAQKMGRANSTYWQDVKNGLAPPPIRLGERSVGWLQSELDAILSARAIASRADIPLDIKVFVSILTAPRLSSKNCTEHAKVVENA